ncbi:MAG: hypothetical protein ACRDJC_08360 [Thermomicrobiales bacterium]
MILGTPKIWWIAAAALFVGALALIGTDIGGGLGNVVGVLFLFAAIAVFAAAPMRYGRSAQPAPSDTAAPEPAPPPTAPSRPRPTIEAGDASEV